ncbi:MAG: urease accessory protein UreF [Alphaproteobacteria bacterium]
MTTEMSLSGARLQRLMTWLSPAFPVGAFSYSHGLEAAVETGMVTDRDELSSWVETIVSSGAGRVDAALFRAAHDAATGDDPHGLAWVLERGDAMQPTRELGLETTSQGIAFADAAARHWPSPSVRRLQEMSSATERAIAYPVAVGAAAADHGIPVLPGLEAYLHGFAANIVSAGVRAIPLGQSDGLQVLAMLEPVIVAAAAAALARPVEDMGSAAIMVDWASSKHETQYSRLFRS